MKHLPEAADSQMAPACLAAAAPADLAQSFKVGAPLEAQRKKKKQNYEKKKKRRLRAREEQRNRKLNVKQQRQISGRSPPPPLLNRLLLLPLLLLLLLLLPNGRARADRLVRLCIASVDAAKLSSQCVMCNRREFPLTVIDCTGITKVNDLIANPLSVQEAKCLIYNCRRQVPHIKPEPYHGSVNNAANYRGAATLGSSYHQHRQLAPAGLPAGLSGPMGPYAALGSGSRAYEMFAPSAMFGNPFNVAGGGGYPLTPASNHQQQQQQQSYLTPFASSHGYPLPVAANSMFASNEAPAVGAADAHAGYPSAVAMRAPRGLIGGPSVMPTNQQALPYALVPAPSAGLLPFGSRKYKAALVPLFK